ncbi:hypothetical protein [Planctobacterium marinum]|uniref:hypothetical protein n=1 Tax=Planctobacterium marinum TaxID=1631968 RepID=UPI001E2AF346|nr:hypothetical protein [Planctobacterium marinum]MCC2604280.1 hypothetical protein [Planctobacterium marinum]
MKSVAFLITLAITLSTSVQAESLKVRGLIQGSLALSVDDELSFTEGGTGILRYDADNKLQLSQALLELSGDLTDYVSWHSVLNATHSPSSHAGLTQLSIKYKPIWSSKYRWQFKAGMFYPEFGFENPDIGWLSPYTYTNSAISSWIGEEVRTLGGEFKVTRPGRFHNRSPHTFAFSGAVYKGNDPAGTLLAWRGWGLHDKQSIVNERVFFADYPSIGEGQALAPQANWVEPYREIDGRWGYQMGLHWDYQKTSRLRYHYFNNNADETVLARGGQYAWHTIFHSLSWQYRFDRNWRLIMHGMHGRTAMGPGAVLVGFNSWYAMIAYRDKQHNFALRFDDFNTIDKDTLIPEDNNNGHGWGLTAAYRYNLDEHWQIGTELLLTETWQASRQQFTDTDAKLSQQQLLAVVQFRF